MLNNKSISAVIPAYNEVKQEGALKICMIYLLNP